MLGPNPGIVRPVRAEREETFTHFCHAEAV